jgi:hypothetical protein
MDCMKLKDLALVLNELLEIDKEAQFILDGDVLQVWSTNKAFIPKNLSKEALVSIVTYEWAYRGEEDYNFYFE